MLVNLPKVIGHRGVKDLAPENTMPSLKESIKHNIKWIEVDVKVSKDKIPFLLHDDVLNRTTSGKGFPYNYLYKEIKRFDAGSWFDKKYISTHPPTLKEVLDFCSNNKIGLNMELKPNKGKEKENVDAIINLFDSYNPDFQYFFSSFDYYSLQLIRNSQPNILLSYLIYKIKDIEHLREHIHKCLDLKCFSIGINLNLINDNLIKKCKDNNLQITVFSNYSIDYETASKLWEIGIDSVFIDNPIHFKKLLF